MRFFVARLWRKLRSGAGSFALRRAGCRTAVGQCWAATRNTLYRLLDSRGFAATQLGVGEWGEWWAERELRRGGYRVLFRRWTDGVGELDLIAWREGRLIFVEVKARRANVSAIGLAEQEQIHQELARRAAESVDIEKQGRLTRAALRFKKKHGLLGVPTRFDIMVVVATDPRRPAVQHWTGAFDATGDRGSMY